MTGVFFLTLDFPIFLLVAPFVVYYYFYFRIFVFALFVFSFDLPLELHHYLSRLIRTPRWFTNVIYVLLAERKIFFYNSYRSNLYFICVHLKITAEMYNEFQQIQQ